MTVHSNSSNTQAPPNNPPNMEDINSVHHPLFFHQNDHPGLVLISKKLTGSDNYTSWKRSMMIALSSRNKLKLINGEFEEPATDSPIKPFWERANDMVEFKRISLTGFRSCTSRSRYRSVSKQTTRFVTGQYYHPRGAEFDVTGLDKAFVLSTLGRTVDFGKGVTE
ncbi:cysteine-rich receptor-like protein kinase 8 [Tanacetum coccineum]